jgi:hypothetical protein
MKKLYLVVAIGLTFMSTQAYASNATQEGYQIQLNELKPYLDSNDPAVKQKALALQAKIKSNMNNLTKEFNVNTPAEAKKDVDKDMLALKSASKQAVEAKKNKGVAALVKATESLPVGHTGTFAGNKIRSRAGSLATESPPSSPQTIRRGSSSSVASSFGKGGATAPKKTEPS